MLVSVQILQKLRQIEYYLNATIGLGYSKKTQIFLIGTRAFKPCWHVKNTRQRNNGITGCELQHFTSKFLHYYHGNAFNQQIKLMLCVIFFQILSLQINQLAQHNKQGHTRTLFSIVNDVIRAIYWGSRFCIRRLSS